MAAMTYILDWDEFFINLAQARGTKKNKLRMSVVAIGGECVEHQSTTRKCTVATDIITIAVPKR
eukprot:143119-Amphidinium_carterae.1